MSVIDILGLCVVLEALLIGLLLASMVRMDVAALDAADAAAAEIDALRVRLRKCGAARDGE